MKRFEAEGKDIPIDKGLTLITGLLLVIAVKVGVDPVKIVRLLKKQGIDAKITEE